MAEPPPELPAPEQPGDGPAEPERRTELALPAPERPDGAGGTDHERSERRDPYGATDESGWTPEQDENLRSARQRGRRNFSSAPASSFGPGGRTVSGSQGTFTQGDSSPAAGTVFGHVIGSINVGLGGRPHFVQQVSRTHLNAIAGGFAVQMRADGTTVLDELRAHLSEHRLVVVAGQPGSGRSALARYGLHAVLPEDERMAMFSLGRRPEQLREMNLSETAGHIVDIGLATRRRTIDDVIDDLAGHAEKDDVRMVVVVDEALLPAGWGHYPLVQHVAPDHEQVLLRLLTRVHRRSAGEVGSLSQLLAGIEPVTMAGLAEAAQAVAAALAAGEPPASYLRKAVQRRVAQKFDRSAGQDEVDADDGGADTSSPVAMTRAERIHAFRRCFMLAAAAFNGLPLTQVTWTAGELSKILRTDDPEAPVISNLFAQPVEPLLDWLEADLVPATDVADPDRLELRNPVTADVILEHVWTSHHLANGSIICWLGELARLRSGHPRQPDEIRLRAAQAVGRLAVYDFGTAMSTVDDWVRSGTVSGLQAASWAVEVMVDDQQIAPEVWSRIREWSSKGRDWRRAALVVYAVGLPPTEVDNALDLVRRVAPRPVDLDYAVAAVLSSAALIGAEERVFALLVDWVQQIDHARRQARRLRMADRLELRSGLRAHAARCLLLLAAGRESGTRARLLRGATDDPELGRTVVELWRLALTDPAVTERAAYVLESWLCDAETEPTMAAECARLLAALGRERTLRNRLRFHARRWITDWAGSYPTAERLLKDALDDRRLPEEGTGT